MYFKSRKLVVKFSFELITRTLMKFWNNFCPHQQAFFNLLNKESQLKMLPCFVDNSSAVGHGKAAKSHAIRNEKKKTFFELSLEALGTQREHNDILSGLEAIKWEHGELMIFVSSLCYE